MGLLMKDALRKTIRRTASLLILAVFFGWVGWYLYRNADQFALIRNVSVPYLAVIYVLAGMIIAVNGLMIKYSLRVFDIEIAWPEWMSLTVVTTTANYLMPMQGGTGMRALYLKSKYRFNFASFICIFVVMYIVNIGLNCIFGLLGLAGQWLAGKQVNAVLAATFTVLLVACIGMINFPFQWRCFQRIRIKPVQEFIEGWMLLRRGKREAAALVLANAAYLILYFCQIKTAFAAIGVYVPTAEMISYSSAQCLAVLMTITPGAIGIVESLSMYLGRGLSLSVPQVLISQGLVRLSIITLAFGLAPFGFHHLGVRMRANSSTTRNLH